MYVLSVCVFQNMLTEGIQLNTHALFLSAERSAYVKTNTYNLFFVSPIGKLQCEARVSSHSQAALASARVSRCANPLKNSRTKVRFSQPCHLVIKCKLSHTSWNRDRSVIIIPSVRCLFTNFL